MNKILIKVLPVFLAICISSVVIPQSNQGEISKPSIIIVQKLEKSKKAKMPKEKELSGYLMVYFKDQTQSANMAVSRDGYTFTDLNGGEPIFDGTKLAEQKGVRDPHIARGPDGAFYLAMTDLYIFG